MCCICSLGSSELRPVLSLISLQSTVRSSWRGKRARSRRTRCSSTGRGLLRSCRLGVMGPLEDSFRSEKGLFVLFCGFWTRPTGTWAYSWQAQGGPYGTPGIEPGSDTCKADDTPTVLLLWPLEQTFFSIITSLWGHWSMCQCLLPEGYL